LLLIKKSNYYNIRFYMKFDKGKEFYQTLISIIHIVNDIFATEYIELDANQKKQIEIERLNKLHEEFVDELKENIAKYSNNDYIIEYLHICFDNFINWKGFAPEMVDAIIGSHQHHVGLVLKLMKTLERYQIIVGKWFTLNENFTQPGKQMMVSFRVVLAEIYKMRYLDDKELIYNRDDLKKVRRHFAGDPGMDTNFDFSKLKAECDKQPAALKKIELINKRLEEFKAWKSGRDVKDTLTRIQIKYELIDLYSPDFEKLCKNEILSLAPLLKTEIKPVAPTTTTIAGDSASTLYQWNASDTDLLELSTSLLMTQSITRKDGKKMTHKELKEAFEKLFGHEIKDAKSKLATAVIRKKSLTPFLDSLKAAFEAYSQERDENKPGQKKIG